MFFLEYFDFKKNGTCFGPFILVYVAAKSASRNLKVKQLGQITDKGKCLLEPLAAKCTKF